MYTSFTELLNESKHLQWHVTHTQILACASKTASPERRFCFLHCKTRSPASFSLTGRRSLHFVKYFFYEKVYYKLLLHYLLSGFLWAWRFFRWGLLLSVLPLFVFVCPACCFPAGDVCVHLLRPGDSGQIPAQGQWAVMAICVIQTAVELELCRAKRTVMVKKPPRMILPLAWGNFYQVPLVFISLCCI